MTLEAKQKNLILYLGASFISLPIIIQTFPFLGWIFFALIPGLIFALNLTFNDYSIKESLSEPLFIIISILVGTFLYGALSDVKSISFEIVKDLVRGFVFLLVVMLILQLKIINKHEFFKKIIDLVCTNILIIGFTGACIGLLKYFGIKLGFKINVLTNTLGEYPWGTSLVSDYNFFALTLLISCLIAIRFWHQAIDLKKSIFYAFIASTILCAGYLSGSRRFLIFGSLLIISYLIILFFENHKLHRKSKWASFVTVLLVFSSLIYGGLYLTDSGCQDLKLGCSKIQNVTEIQHRAERIFTEPHSVTSARIDRWLYTFEIIKPTEFLFGTGFSYRQEFGCRFQDCKSDDYPHTPILSAFLYGGVMGLFGALSCLIYALISACQILTRHSSHADLALGLIATTVFVSISGDSLLSMPVFFSMLLISRCVVWLK